MSTAASNARREWWPWFGHNAWKFFIASFIINAVPSRWYLPYSAYLSGVVTFVVVMTFFASNDHDRHLCDRCIAAWPLDPQREIEKHDRALKGVHFAQDLLPKFTPQYGRKVGRWIVAAVVGLGFLGITILVSTFLPQWCSDVLRAGINLFLLPGLFWSIYQHHRLQGWCPYCRHGGRGKHTFNPDPVPSPSKTKDLV